jgi:hypothetical protein
MEESPGSEIIWRRSLLVRKSFYGEIFEGGFDYRLNSQEKSPGEQVKSHFTVAFVQCGGPDEEG